MYVYAGESTGTGIVQRQRNAVQRERSREAATELKTVLKQTRRDERETERKSENGEALRANRRDETP